MPASLDALAAELHIAIIDCIEKDDIGGRRRALHSLCLSTLNLNIAATPYLYQLFTTWDHCQSSIQPLLRTLCHNPDLLKHMRAIALGPFPTECFVPHSDHLLVQKLHEFSQTVPEARHLSEATVFGCFAAEMLLLVCMAKHVKRMLFFLHPIEDNNTADQVLCWQLLLNIFSKETAETGDNNLETVFIHGYARPWLRNGDSLATLAPFLKLPSLRHLHCSGLASLEGSAEWTCEQNTSNVTELELDDCHPSTIDTVRILTACKSLRKLTMRWDSQVEEAMGDDALEAPPDVDQQIIIAALAKHATTLEELVITNLADGGQSFKSCRGSLGAFKTLRTLEVDEKVLAGWLMWRHTALGLPPNLVDLTIHMNRQALDQHGCIDNVLFAISGCDLPCLESLAISCDWVRILTLWIPTKTAKFEQRLASIMAQDSLTAWRSRRPADTGQCILLKPALRVLGELHSSPSY